METDKNCEPSALRLTSRAIGSEFVNYYTCIGKCYRYIYGAMDSGMVRCAFTNILDKLGRKTHSPRIVKAHELCKAIQECSDREITLFEDFSSELLGILNGPLQPSATYRSSSAKREKLWSNFHQMCLVGLPEIWERFLSSLAVEYDDDLLQQSVSQELFEMILPSQFSHPTQLQSQVSYAAVELSEDELNALRYACGYVPYSLLRRYEKLSSDKYTKFVECLGQMAVQCEVSDDDILAYTREWMNRVNRGGLFPLNDMTYIFCICGKGSACYSSHVHDKDR